MEDGSLEPRAVGHAKTSIEQFPRLEMEDSSTEKCLRSAWETAVRQVFTYCIIAPTTNYDVEYAAAFFLLAGNLRDAVNVCANQLQDLQLAIAIARVHGGDDCLVLRELLEDNVLPQAAFDGNRWLATWAFWMLGRRDMAVRALIVRMSSSI